MPALSQFLQRLLAEGDTVLSDRPVLERSARPQVVRVLEKAYASYRLGIPGPMLDFDPESALAAAEMVWLASWFLLVREQEPDEVERTLKEFALPHKGRLPGQHLSVDLTLRYLPGIHQRARSLAADDVLTRTLAQILRQWPLSGVLADLHEPPLLPIEDLEHPGLLLLYAERLAAHPREAWMPNEGLARQWVERVFEERKERAGAARDSRPVAS